MSIELNYAEKCLKRFWMEIETEFPQFFTPKTQNKEIKNAQARTRKKRDQFSSPILWNLSEDTKRSSKVQK